MAIAFVAFAETTSTAASTMVVTLPTHSEDDFIGLAFVHDYNSDNQIVVSVNNGYTELKEISISGLAHQSSIWIKRAGASESNPTATYDSSTQEMACLAFSFSGPDGTTLIDAEAINWEFEDPGNADIDSPSVTTVTDGAMLISVVSADENDAFTKPASMTLVDELQFNNMTVAVAFEEIPTAETTGVRTWDFAQSTDELTAFTFAIRPAVDSGNTLTADSGTYTYTGTAAALTTARILTAESGAYTYTGTAAGLPKGSLLTADTGSYTYTGTNADLLRGLILNADSGAYTYTGTAAPLQQGRILTADSGSYTYTGTEVTLTFASVGNFILTADTGAYTYSGTSIDLLTTRILAADSGAYTYTGTAIDLSRGFVLSADSGAYTYAGTNIDFVQQRILNAISGAYVYNGTNANIFFTPVAPDVPEAKGINSSGAFGNGITANGTFGNGIGSSSTFGSGIGSKGNL